MSQVIPIPPLIPGDLEVSAFQVTRPKVIKGTVTQLVDATTAVTVNAAAGVVTTFAETVAANGSQAFTVNNTFVGPETLVLASIQDYTGSTGLPTVIVDTIASNSFQLVVQNGGSGALNGVLKISFLVV
jgi:hypothetical protein